MDTNTGINSDTVKNHMELLGYALPPVGLILIILLIWQLAAGSVPDWQFPAPAKIFASMLYDFGDIAPHLLLTCRNILIGFLIAVSLGLLVASAGYFYRAFGMAVTPLINLMCIIPLITLVPLLMLWVGFGSTAKITAIVLQSFPIVNLNASTSFANVDTLRLEFMRSMRAAKLQTLFRCMLPDAAQGIFTGIKLSMVFSITTEIAGEIVGGSEGVGARLIQYTMYMKMPQAFACVFYIALTGGALYLILNYLEYRIAGKNV